MTSQVTISTMTSQVTFSIGEVAEMVGISAHTIRAWERRYGVLSPARTPSNRRRYTAEEVEQLVLVKRAVSSRGLSIKLAVMKQEGILPSTGDEENPEQLGGMQVQHDPGPWRSVADLMPELLLIVNLDGTLIDANIAVAKAVGMVRERLSALKFVDLVEPYDRAKAVTLYRKPARRRGWELNIKTRYLRGLYSFDSWPLRTPQGRLLVLVGSDLNRTDRPWST
jgi:DNA-binding transcriptional MerR regulator